MPKIRWNDSPPALWEHLFERLRERKISAEDLYELKVWRESEPEAPPRGLGTRTSAHARSVVRGVSEDLPPPWSARTGPQTVVVVEAEATEGSMARKKRNLFRELAAGIRAMRDHAEGKIELRTTFVSASRTVLENAASGRTPSRRQGPDRGSRT